MELTTEQALQQGVAAHREGNIQEAERFYRGILQSRPKHPDANHNLGVIAAAENQPEAAILFFQTALEANPKIEQFWISYIDILVKQRQFERAEELSVSLERFPNQLFGWKVLGALFGQSGRYTQSLNASQRALATGSK